MLRSLLVKDFAIIDRAELALGPGMTVLTGETGAGKSLLVDALMLIAGARAEAAMVRAGAERAELSAEFDLAAQPGIRAALAELELDAGEECRIRRVVRADGSSRAFINDQPVTVATLKTLGARLVEIHGQHEHQALLSRASQLALLDAVGGHDAERAAVTAAARRWQRLEDEIVQLAERAGTGGELIDLMRHQLEELTRHALAPDALHELEEEHRRLSHAGELVQGCARLADIIDGERDHALRELLATASGELVRLVQIDARLEPMQRALADAALQVDEAMAALQRYLAGQDLDPDRLGALDAQLSRLHDLARKHRVPVAELQARARQLQADYDALAGADERLAALRAEQLRARADYDAAANALSRARAVTADRLSAEVTRLMQELGMAGGRLAVELQTDAEAAPTAGGRDQIEFTVSANPGQPLRPLRKVASGGELSRIALAIEVAALGKDEVATMVFDEVDAGIGGAVAEVVGRKLAAVASARQVLCVTHLAQVAAQATEHVTVRKSRGADSTRTEIVALDDGARIEELARMLGGVTITAETRALAAAMRRDAAR